MFGDDDPTKLTHRINLRSFCTMNYRFSEHIQKSMFSRPEMCLETIAEKTRLIELIRAGFCPMNYSSWEHIRNSMFSNLKCVWKQLQKKWLIELICAVFVQ